jgi:nitroreductase
MEWEKVVRSRRMVRDFTDAPVDDAMLERLLDLARRVPSAGFSQGIDFIVLNGVEQTARFWDRTLPPDERAAFPWPGLLQAPVLVLPMADAAAYVARYAQPDKAHAGLGTSADDWPIPYWYVDTAMAAMTLLHGVVDAGLGALFFGIFRNEAELLADLGVPAGIRPVGAIAIGHPTDAARAVQAEGSARTRRRRPLEETVHRNGW